MSSENPFKNIVSAIRTDLAIIDASIAELSLKREKLVTMLKSLAEDAVVAAATSSNPGSQVAAGSDLSQAMAVNSIPAAAKADHSAPTVREKRKPGPKPKSKEPISNPSNSQHAQVSTGSAADSEIADKVSVFEKALELCIGDEFTMHDIRAKMKEINPEVEKGLRENYITNRLNWLVDKKQIVALSEGVRGQPKRYARVKSS